MRWDANDLVRGLDPEGTGMQVLVSWANLVDIMRSTPAGRALHALLIYMILPATDKNGVREGPGRRKRGQLPPARAASILAGSKPIKTISPMTSVGVPLLLWTSRSSRKASGSALTSFDSNSTPFCERYSFAELQAGQPGWLYTITFMEGMPFLR